MPHYADGTEAKIGDLVHGKTHSGKDPVAGYVIGVTPGATTCNAYIAALRDVRNPTTTYGGTILSVAACSGTDERFFGYVHSEVANCSDLTLIFRKEDPV